MHLLIDIRTSCLSDLPYTYYGRDWGAMWERFHPHDTITYLVSPGQEIEGKSCIPFDTRYSFFSKKIANHSYGPDRVVSFSRLPTLDTSLPTIFHIGDLRETLYKGDSARGIFEEFFWKRSLSQAQAIIVPWKEVGEDLSEIYGLDTDKMHILPYLEVVRKNHSKKTPHLTYSIADDYFVTEGTPTEEWQPMELIQAYSQYIHNEKGSEELIIIGDLAENLGMIAALIRSLDLIQKVKIIGILPKDEREAIYRKSKGWISIGRYYSRGPSYRLALDHDIPLFTTSIAGLRDMTTNTLHPNHPEELSTLLRIPSKGEKPEMDIEQIMHLYARIIAS